MLNIKNHKNLLFSRLIKKQKLRGMLMAIQQIKNFQSQLNGC